MVVKSSVNSFGNVETETTDALCLLQEMEEAELRFKEELSALEHNLTRQFRKDVADACDATIIEQQAAAQERLEEEVEPLQVCTATLYGHRRSSRSFVVTLSRSSTYSVLLLGEFTLVLLS